MTFNPNSQLDSSQVSRGGGGARRGGPVVVGGGIGGIVLLVIGVILFGPDILFQQQAGPSQTQGQPGESLESKCQTGQDANEDVECRVVGTVNSLNAYWPTGAAQLGVEYRNPAVQLTSGSWQTGCGQGNSNMGPFYCPADETAYFDVSFFDLMRQQLGAKEGPLPEEYVVAHEFGHHIQNLTGDIARTSDGQTGPQSNAVRTELQADCFAGVWARNAAETTGEGGEPFLQPLTDEDIEAALGTASAIGDDHIQETSGGRVTPENFTHGSSEQRMTWFKRGYDTGDPKRCNAFDVERV